MSRRRPNSNTGRIKSHPLGKKTIVQVRPALDQKTMNNLNAAAGQMGISLTELSRRLLSMILQEEVPNHEPEGEYQKVLTNDQLMALQAIANKQEKTISLLIQDALVEFHQS